ncbi:RNA polymerase factor sigma-32 [Bradyrhizobium sp. HKCCYLS1011]|uniref:RNA polymerase factor sigma-32 n=1 Tax=Bradyrhizobium sp. HKCCYLS1011 TaxID=3420733 RepID=UPI003EB70EA7
MPVKSVAVADKTLDVAGRAGGYAKDYALIIKRYDLLERGQEQELARRWHERHDRVASDVLVTSHLRLAARVARRYQGYGLPLSDLIAEANLGLVIAASRFEAGREARFSTYAIWWIKAAIHDYILRSWSLVKIGTTSAQRKLFFGLRREMRKFAGTTSGLTPEIVEAVARELEVSPRDVIEMDCRLTGDLSLNTPITDDGQTTEWQAMLVDGSPDAETIVGDHDERAQRSEALHAALGVLSERERRVLEVRRLADDPPSLEALGREMSISNERVRQIEARAFEKVKRAAADHLARKAAARLTAPRLTPACPA